VNIAATLAPGVYSPPKSVSVLLNAIEHSIDIGALNPNVWISQGATITVPLTARVLSNGSAQSNVQVIYFLVAGSGTLSAASAQTNVNGCATVNLSVSEIASQAEVMTCVSGGSPCSPFNFYVTPLAQQNLQAVAGAGQISTGQAFQPVVVRVMNSSSPPNPVLAAPISFLTMVLRRQGSSGEGGGGECDVNNSGMPVILSAIQSLTSTDINGLANVVPSSGGFDPPVEVDVGVTAGSGVMLDFPLQVLPSMGIGSSAKQGISAKRPLRGPESAVEMR
jgi:hypothetical protein